MPHEQEADQQRYRDGTRTSAAGRAALAGGSARARRGTIRRARPADRPRRGMALHERVAARRDRFRPGRSDVGHRRAAGRIRLRRRAGAAGGRQRPLRHDAVAHKGLPAGVQAGSLAAALNDHADIVQRYFGQLADFSSRSFTALNTAFVQDGAFLHIPEGVVVETPIHVVFVSGADGGEDMAIRAPCRGGRGSAGAARRELRRRRGRDLLRQRRVGDVRRRERGGRPLSGAAGIARASHIASLHAHTSRNATLLVALVLARRQARAQRALPSSTVKAATARSTASIWPIATG